MGTWSLNVPENGDLVTLLPGERNQESHLPSHIEIPYRENGDACVDGSLSRSIRTL